MCDGRWRGTVTVTGTRWQEWLCSRKRVPQGDTPLASTYSECQVMHDEPLWERRGERLRGAPGSTRERDDPSSVE